MGLNPNLYPRFESSDVISKLQTAAVATLHKHGHNIWELNLSEIEKSGF
jgi:hypothetical protein